MSKKPREFWIEEEVEEFTYPYGAIIYTKDPLSFPTQPATRYEYIHLIEYKAYEELKLRFDELAESALNFVIGKLIKDKDE